MRHWRTTGTLLLVSVCVPVWPAHGDDPKTAKLQRLCEQATKVMQTRIVAEGHESGCLLRTFNQLFGWERQVLAAVYPAEVLLHDQVLDTLVRDVPSGPKGLEPFSENLESLVVHLTYGADFGVPSQVLLDMNGQVGTGAEICPQLWSANDYLIRQVDSEIQQTRASVYATLRVRDTATQRQGRLFLFLSISLAEVTPGQFQWHRLAETQRFISESSSRESQSTFQESRRNAER